MRFWMGVWGLEHDHAPIEVVNGGLVATNVVLEGGDVSLPLGLTVGLGLLRNS